MIEAKKWTLGTLAQKWREEKPEEPRHPPLSNSPNGYPEDGTYVLKPVAKLKAYNRRTISGLSECRDAVLDLVERSLARHDRYSSNTIILRGYWPPIYEMDTLNSLPLEILQPCRTLSVSKNMIEMISGLKVLKNLKVLSIAQNQIKSLSGLEAVSGTLEELIVAWNMIKKVDTLSCMEKLKVLDISFNHIDDLTEYGKLKFCRALRHLVFQENPVCKKYLEDVWRDMAVRKLPNLRTLDGTPLRKSTTKKEK